MRIFLTKVINWQRKINRGKAGIHKCTTDKETVEYTVDSLKPSTMSTGQWVAQCSIEEACFLALSHS